MLVDSRNLCFVQSLSCDSTRVYRTGTQFYERYWVTIKVAEQLLLTSHNRVAGNEMNYKGSGKVHFGVDDVSLYGTPKEEPGPGLPGQEVKQSFLKNQLQALFQPTDNKLAMKLFGSKKALMKERIRQKAAGHWVIHPCSSFRYVLRLSADLIQQAASIFRAIAFRSGWKTRSTEETSASTGDRASYLSLE